jgi:hypothetical protein
MKAGPSAASIDVRGESRLSRTARGDHGCTRREPQIFGSRLSRPARASVRVALHAEGRGGDRGLASVLASWVVRQTSVNVVRSQEAFERARFYTARCSVEGRRGAQLEVVFTTASDMTARSGSRRRSREIAAGPRRAFIDGRRSGSPQRGCPSRAPRQSDLGCRCSEGRAKAKLTPAR